MNQPQISIGLPVYNGERFIEEAIDSLLSQSYTNFEIIISDNASTDKTEEICRTYLKKDTRIRYYRATENRGASWNFNHVFNLSTGEYFKWAAYDDIYAPEFLLKCITVLDQNPSILLCYSKAIDIDEHGNYLKDNNYNMKISSAKPHQRFHDLIYINHSCLAVFGLMRPTILKKTQLIGNYVASDRVLLATLGLFGSFYEVPEVLFFHREHAMRSTRAIPLHSRTKWFDPQKAARIVFPNWRLFLEYFLAVFRAPLVFYQKIFCYSQLIFWVRRYWRNLIQDLALAIREYQHNYKFSLSKNVE
jgi:glycosyltransferase involved in cell wall biosynthesis